MNPDAGHLSVADGRWQAPAALTLLAITLGGCVSSPRHTTPQPPAAPPAEVSQIPDAVPRAEPRSARGNPPFYEVFGKRYFVMDSADGYRERGIASWYGPGFHAESTSNGERYDMYAMTAAHKTLPLPSYVEVTNLRNGNRVVVRVNDRGPFKDGRIIDLSYTAAAKLDMLREGTTMVEVRALQPGEVPMQAAAPPSTPVLADTTPAAGEPLPVYVQAGAFSTEANATRLLGQLRERGFNEAFVREDVISGQRLYRVRIGPLANAEAFDDVVRQLNALGVSDARLAAD